MNIRNYRNLFRYEVTVDPKTGKKRRKSIYVGEYYVMDRDDKGRKKLSAAMALMWAGAAVSFVTAGMMNTPSTRVTYVALFYMLQLIPLAYWALGWLSCLRLPQKLTQLQKRENMDSVKHCGLGLAGLAGTTLVADAVFAMTGGWQENPGAEALFAGLTLLGGLLGLGIFRILRKVKYQIEK